MKSNPILGNGDYTLMRVEDSISGMKGLGIVDSNRFNTFAEVGEEVDIQHIKSLDENKDIIIHFVNIRGLDALLDELNLLKKDMENEK